MIYEKIDKMKENRAKQESENEIKRLMLLKEQLAVGTYFFIAQLQYLLSSE